MRHAFRVTPRELTVGTDPYLVLVPHEKMADSDPTKPPFRTKRSERAHCRNVCKLTCPRRLGSSQRSAASTPNDASGEAPRVRIYRPLYVYLYQTDHPLFKKKNAHRRAAKAQTIRSQSTQTPCKYSNPSVWKPHALSARRATFSLRKTTNITQRQPRPAPPPGPDDRTQGRRSRSYQCRRRPDCSGRRHR